MSAGQLDERAARLRALFDQGFSEPLAAPAEDHVDLLSLRIAGERYLLRLSDAAVVLVDRKVLPLPTSAPGFVGVVGVRAEVVPVYSLRALLGHGAGEDGRWLAVARGAQVAFAFEQLDGCLRVPRESIVAWTGGAADAELVREGALAPTGTRPVIALAAVIQRIQAAGAPSPGQE